MGFSRSWYESKYDQIVKQTLDDSCGAASLATILRRVYGVSVGEDEILKLMDDDGKTSFSDLAKVAGHFGFNAVGVRLSFVDLKSLRLPAIAYLKYRGQDHFSVLLGVNASNSVHLADPRWGHRYFRASQFIEMWGLDNIGDARGGRLLLIMSNEESDLETSLMLKDFDFRLLTSHLGSWFFSEAMK